MQSIKLFTLLRDSGILEVLKLLLRRYKHITWTQITLETHYQKSLEVVNVVKNVFETTMNAVILCVIKFDSCIIYRVHYTAPIHLPRYHNTFTWLINFSSTICLALRSRSTCPGTRVSIGSCCMQVGVGEWVSQGLSTTQHVCGRIT